MRSRKLATTFFSSRVTTSPGLISCRRGGPEPERMIDDLFPRFASHWIDGEAGRVFARAGGSGPPLVLLHGFPETHACFHRIPPALARTHTVVRPDLRGYGWSSAPKSDPVHETYSKRAMGRDVIRVMEKLGHVRFALAGHDRGARVAPPPRPPPAALASPTASPSTSPAASSGWPSSTSSRPSPTGSASAK